MASFVTEGTVLRRGDGGSPEVFTAISQIVSLDPAGASRSLIDVTNLSSAAREYKTALKDGAEISVELQYDPGDAEHTGLKTDLDGGTTRNMQIELQTSPVQTWDFAALVTGWNIGAAVDNVYPLRVTLKPTGDITITP